MKPHVENDLERNGFFLTKSALHYFKHTRTFYSRFAKTLVHLLSLGFEPKNHGNRKNVKIKQISLKYLLHC
jgi:hypothetical protein